MSSPVTPQTAKSEYQIVAPDGRRLIVSQAVFDAIDDMVRRKCTGSVILEFKNGSFQMARSEYRKVFT
jgi:hypothetical protein